MRTLSQVTLLCVSGAFLGLAMNALAPEPLPLLASADLFKEAVPEGSDVATSELRELWESGEVLFIDARSEEAFSKGHIPGAFSLPYKAFEQGTPDLVNDLPKDQQLVIYCDGADCHASKVVYEKLLEFGFEEDRLRIFSGGWTEWVKQGGEVEPEGQGVG